MFNFRQYDWKKYNYVLLIIMVVLGICSAYFVKFAATQTMGIEQSGAYFKKQIICLVMGLVIAIVVSLMDYKRVCDFAIIYYVISTLLVLATKLPVIGTDAGTDSYRWIKIPGTSFTFQSSEICKVALIITLAVFFKNKLEEINSIKTIVLAIVIFMIPTSIILTQSDLSSSLVIFFIFAIMIFAAGLSYKIVVPTILILIPLVVGGIWLIQQPIVQNIIPKEHRYQVNRVVAFLHPDDEYYALNDNYQQLKSVSAIASGELTGKLLDKSESVSRNYSSVDVCESDFIFAVIAEEIGFVGSGLILLLLCLVVFSCIRTAQKCNDTIGYLIAIGISAMLMFQIFANIGVATMILPNTGLPLPFLSSGISSMIACAIEVGLIINIGIQSGTGDRRGISFL